MQLYKSLFLTISFLFSVSYVFAMDKGLNQKGSRLADRRNFSPEKMFLDEKSINASRRIESVAILKKIVVVKIPISLYADLYNPLKELPFSNEDEVPDQKSNTVINFFDCCAQSYNQKPSE